jgi:hypothetical protein
MAPEAPSTGRTPAGPSADDSFRDAKDITRDSVATGSPAGQGVETGAGAVAEQARDLEQRVIEEYAGVSDPSQVRVTREGDTLTAELTDSGRLGARRAARERSRRRTRDALEGVGVGGTAASGYQAPRSGEQTLLERNREYAARNLMEGLGVEGTEETGYRGPRSPRGMRVATAMAYDEAVARTNQEYKTRRSRAYVSPREAQEAEVIDYDWSAAFDTIENTTGVDVPFGGDPETDEVEDFLREGQRRWETERIGLLGTRFGPSVGEIREGYGRELGDAREASGAYAESQGLTNAEYGMSQLLGAPTSPAGRPTYVSRTNEATLGVLPSTLPLNVPGAAQGGLEFVESTTGAYAERQQAKREAIEEIVSGSPGRITENPDEYGALFTQAVTGAPTTGTESAETLREGGAYTARVGQQGLEYAAENPNQAIVGGASIAGQAVVGGAALARGPSVARRIASAAPDGATARRLLKEERAMAKLSGRSRRGDTGKTVLTGDDLNTGGFRQHDRLGNRRNVRPGKSEYREPRPPSEGDGMNLGYRSASTELGENYLDAQRLVNADYAEFAGTRRAAGQTAGAASGVVGGATSRLEYAQQPQAVLDDPVSGQEEDLGYAAGVYAGTLGGQFTQYREDPATIEDTTQLWSDRIDGDTDQAVATDSITGVDTGLTPAQAPIGGTQTRSGVGTTPVSAQTPATDTGVTQDQTVVQGTPTVQTPVTGQPVAERPGPVMPVPLRPPWTPRRTPDPDVGDDQPPRWQPLRPDASRPRVSTGGGGRATNPVNELAVSLVFGLNPGARDLPGESRSGGPGQYFGEATSVEVSGSEAEQEAVAEAQALLSGLQVGPEAFFDSGDGDDAEGWEWF